MNQNKVYFPTDFSACADNALKFAIQFAKATKGSIEIIHNIDVNSGPSASMITKHSMGIVSMVEEEAKIKLTLIEHQIKEAGISVFSQIIFGDKLVEFLSSKESNEGSMIVMGTKGASNVENRLFGSITHKIIREISLPILVVPQDAEFNGISDILFAADYSSVNENQFNEIIKIGSYFHSHIHAVHVTDINAQNNENNLTAELEQKIENLTTYQPLDFQLLYARNAEERLDSMIVEQNMNLLVLVTKKRSFFERLFGQSLTQKMVYHSKIPMLVFQKI